MGYTRSIKAGRFYISTSNRETSASRKDWLYTYSKTAPEPTRNISGARVCVKILLGREGAARGAEFVFISFIHFFFRSAMSFIVQISLRPFFNSTPKCFFFFFFFF